MVTIFFSHCTTRENERTRERENEEGWCKEEGRRKEGRKEGRRKEKQEEAKKTTGHKSVDV